MRIGRAGKTALVTGSSAGNDLAIARGSAEAGASAVNLVNAVGSMVTNGVNIAYTSNMNASPSITQVNSITQTH